MRNNTFEPHTTHPDYQEFIQFGSFGNLLTRDYEQGEFLNAAISAPTHYSKSQDAFGHHSMASLIGLQRGFVGREIFDFSTASVTKDEIKRFEGLYQKIAEDRYDIAQNTKSQRAQFSAMQNFKRNWPITRKILTQKNVSPSEQEFIDLSYRGSEKQSTTGTILSNQSRYNKYNKDNKDDLFGGFCLDIFVKLLGEKVLPQDDKIILGNIERDRQDWCIRHRMGIYHNQVFADDAAKEAAKNRVDEITALAAKKALTAENEDEALKYAFLFAALRGYNTRSTVGACWAQEMSLRWIFAQRGWPQFCKAPGVYLDIEACFLGMDDQEKKLDRLMEKQVRDYKASLTQGETEVGSLFSKPSPSLDADFMRHLIETKKYRQEDLSELLFYKLGNPKFLNVFETAAKNGDRDFFAMASKLFRSSADFRGQILAHHGEIKLVSAAKMAAEYGDLDLVGEIKNFDKNISQQKFSRNFPVVSMFYGTLRNVGMRIFDAAWSFAFGGAKVKAPKVLMAAKEEIKKPVEEKSGDESKLELRGATVTKLSDSLLNQKNVSQI